MGWRTKKTKQGNVFEGFSWYNSDKAMKKFTPHIQGGDFATSNPTVNQHKRTLDENNYLDEVNGHIKELNEYVAIKSIEIDKEVTQVIEKADKEQLTFSKLYRFFKEKASVINDAFIHEEEINQERRLNLRNEVNNFRLENQLEKREANYPKSYILHFAWIFIFIFIEALINSYFFGEASSLGLLGGVFIGFITSFFNVTLSTFAGYVLRYKNHISLAKKIVGYVGFLLLMGMIFFLHLFIAHYREILSINPDVQIWLVLEPVLKEPFGLYEMESIILVGLGLLVTLFSIFKGLHLDDSYPAYGAVYRRWKAQEDAFLKSKKQARTLMRELYGRSLQKSDKMMEELMSSKKRLENLLSDIDVFINTYRSYHLRAMQGARSLLSSYREGGRLVYGNTVEFAYDDTLLMGDNGLKELDEHLLLESKELVEGTLKDINQHIDDFLTSQKTFEAQMDVLRENYLNDDTIEKVLYQIKHNRELEL